MPGPRFRAPESGERLRWKNQSAQGQRGRLPRPQSRLRHSVCSDTALLCRRKSFLEYRRHRDQRRYQRQTQWLFGVTYAPTTGHRPRDHHRAVCPRLAQSAFTKDSMMNSTTTHMPAAPQFNGSSSLRRENSGEPFSRPPLPSLPSGGGQIFGEPGDPSVALGIERACSEQDAAKETANTKQKTARKERQTKQEKTVKHQTNNNKQTKNKQ